MIGNVMSDMIALITNADAVSASCFSNRVAIMAATAEPGKATSNTAFVISSAERPIRMAMKYISNGCTATLSNAILKAGKLSLILRIPTVTPTAKSATLMSHFQFPLAFHVRFQEV